MNSKITARPISDKLKSKPEVDVKVRKDSQRLDSQQVKKHYTFLRRTKNAEFDAGVKVLPLRSCLIHDKSAVFRGAELYVKTRPKWLTDLFCEGFDVSTGESVSQEVYRTDEFKASNAGKIKRLDAFCGHFQPLYARGEVSLLFFTFTLANQAKTDIKRIVDVLKKRLKRRGVKMHGYIWTAEVSDNLHFHYHMAVAVDRLRVRGAKMPAWLKLDAAWGARTGVNFVKKNIRHYMAKYFAKHQARIIGIRSYGCSIPKKPK